jgi:glycosyltransferase involved in cell wall biosynthesis
MRGGEKVLEQFCELFPEADIFTHVYVPGRISEKIRRHRVQTTFINKLPGASRHHQRYLPLMPFALEQLDLRGYDLVISSEAGPAKGVVSAPGTVHICYCHSPMRYVWDMYHEHLRYLRRPSRTLMRLVAHYLRMWDAESARRVDIFVANSRFVAERIRKYYRREAEVICPPVDTQAFSTSTMTDDFYLMVSQLVLYKRVDVAIEAFNRSGRKLIVIGEGEESKRLRATAKPNVTLLGYQPLEVVRSNYSKCRALIFPGVEDFGIVPVEAMASGRPIIAYRRGGVLDTVVDGTTGLFFNEQSPEALNEALDSFEQRESSFSAVEIAKHAARFDQAIFRQAIRALVDRVLTDTRLDDPLEGQNGRISSTLEQ